MATTKKEEQIFIALGNEVIELTGKDKQDFIEQRTKDQAESQANKEALENQKALKVSAYTKLGLTEEEINAIL
jgi:hypothetical protein